MSYLFVNREWGASVYIYHGQQSCYFVVILRLISHKTITVNGGVTETFVV